LKIPINWSGYRAGWHDPLDGLLRHRSNDVEVAITVEHDETGALGYGSGQQIRDARGAMLALAREPFHHPDGSVEVRLLHVDDRECVPIGLDLDEVAMAARAEQQLELDDAVAGDIPREEQRRQALVDAGMR